MTQNTLFGTQNTLFVNQMTQNTLFYSFSKIHDLIPGQLKINKITLSKMTSSTRHDFCQKLYNTGFSGQLFYTVICDIVHSRFESMFYMVELVETNMTSATTWWLLRWGNLELRQRHTLIRFLLTHWHCCSVVDDDGDGDGDCGYVFFESLYYIIWFLICVRLIEI